PVAAEERHRVRRVVPALVDHGSEPLRVSEEERDRPEAFARHDLDPGPVRREHVLLLREVERDPEPVDPESVAGDSEASGLGLGRHLRLDPRAAEGASEEREAEDEEAVSKPEPLAPEAPPGRDSEREPAAPRAATELEVVDVARCRVANGCHSSPMAARPQDASGTPRGPSLRSAAREVGY